MCVFNHSMLFKVITSSFIVLLYFDFISTVIVIGLFIGTVMVQQRENKTLSGKEKENFCNC